MELTDVIRTRRSVRAFAEEGISHDVIEDLVELAGQAPSSFNRQPWCFHVVSGLTRDSVCSILCHSTSFVAEYLETLSLSSEEIKLAEAFFADLGNAPVILGVSAPDSDDEIDEINTLLSVGGAVQNLQLAAHDRGLATCALTFSYWVREDLIDVFGVEEGWNIVAMVLLGKPAKPSESLPSPGRRADILDIVE